MQQYYPRQEMPGAYPTLSIENTRSSKKPILLSNESPILIISHSSLDAINADIIATGGKPASPYVFRANIIISEQSNSPQHHQPFIEDSWKAIQIGEKQLCLDILGPCRRCYMVCIDQDTAERNEEPFVTLAKKRRWDGKVWFGVHASLRVTEMNYPTLCAGDVIVNDSAHGL
jgi:molybdenum cofactor sulfurtransferase